jgi:hypothetical protein
VLAPLSHEAATEHAALLIRALSGKRSLSVPHNERGGRGRKPVGVSHTSLDLRRVISWSPVERATSNQEIAFEKGRSCPLA